MFERVENIVGKGENAGYQHFLLFPQCFQKASLSGLLKVRLFGKELNPLAQKQGFRPIQNKGRCRQQGNCDHRIEINLMINGKNCGKVTKCLLPAVENQSKMKVCADDKVDVTTKLKLPVP